MMKFILDNGLTTIYERTDAGTVTVQVCVMSGSNSESQNTLGISHFIEHLLFEGTKNRPNSKLIAQEIEKYGGEFNAYTSDERTCYYVKIINKHFDIALEVISDMIQYPLFKARSIEQERKIILDEINLVTDEPRNHQWVLLKQTLFDKHPNKYPTYGTVETMKSIHRKNIIKYYREHYIPNNMILSITGNVGDLSKVRKKVINNLNNLKYTPKSNRRDPIEEQLTKLKKKKEIRKINSTYVVLGYKTTPRIHKDSYILDVIKAILSGGQSSWLFQELRVKSQLGYDVGAYHEPESTIGFFAIYLVTAKKNVDKAIKLILNLFTKLKKINKQQLQDAKSYIEGSHKVQEEDSQIRSDNLCFWEQISTAEDSKRYFNRVKAVTLGDIKRVAKKYLTKNYALAIIEQE